MMVPTKRCFIYADYEIIDDIVDGYLSRAWYAANRHGVIFPYEDHRIYHSKASSV